MTPQETLDHALTLTATGLEALDAYALFWAAETAVDFDDDRLMTLADCEDDNSPLRIIATLKSNSANSSLVLDKGFEDEGEMVYFELGLKPFDIEVESTETLQASDWRYAEGELFLGSTPVNISIGYSSMIGRAYVETFDGSDVHRISFPDLPADETLAA